MKPGSTRLLHFRDNRTPCEVRFALERELRTLFIATMENDKLCLLGKATLVGANYEFYLRFDAALQTCNCYSLRMDVSWPEQTACNEDYYLKTFGSWFAFWTREFVAANPPLAGEGSSPLYHDLCENALNAEYQLDSIAAIQHAIIEAMKRGAVFRTSHKEGGTRIYWKSDRFVRSDYGNYPAEQQFIEDTEFLKMLRQFCDGDVNRNTGTDQLSETDTWRVILRQLYLP